MEEAAQVEQAQWNETTWGKYFHKDFIRRPGAHLLGISKTNTGKTMRAIILAGHCIKEGKKNIAWFDSSKSDEVLYLLTVAQKTGAPVRILYPGALGCSVKVEGSPVPIEYISIERPGEMFRLMGPGINIASIRPFFTELTPYVKYLSRAMNGLINDAYRRKINLQPLQIFMDEFQTICPAKRIHETSRQQELGARIAMAIYTLRSEGIGLAAFSQSYRNIAPSVRPQFDYYMAGRAPDGDPRDYIGKILFDYTHLLAKLKPSQCIIIFPNGMFPREIISFPLPAKPPGATVTYEGYQISSRVRDDSDDERT